MGAGLLRAAVQTAVAVPRLQAGRHQLEAACGAAHVFLKHCLAGGLLAAYLAKSKLTGAGGAQDCIAEIRGHARASAGMHLLSPDVMGQYPAAAHRPH